MYPILRLLYQLGKYRNAPALPIDGVHVSQHRCRLSDIDPWMEMNNGRILTIFDHARVPFARRIPLAAAMRVQGWGMTMAGNTLRYRRRIKLGSRMEIRTRTIGRDARFFYMQQTMWVKSEAAASGVFRAAIVDENGIVPTEKVVNQMEIPDWNPPMPDWINIWIKAEAARAWPPET